MCAVEEAIHQSEYAHMQVPLSWMRALDKVGGYQSSYIPLDEFTMLADSCSVHKDEVAPLLHFLNGTGNVMWHNGPGLSDVVILDPIAFFVKPATIIICKHVPDEDDPTQHITPIHKEASKKHMRKWLKLTESGILASELLPTLWQDYERHASTLLALMIKYGLLVPLRGPDTSQANTSGHHEVRQSDRYLVPALLPLSTPEMHIWFEDREYSTCFFVFTATDDLECTALIDSHDLREGGFLPSGLFERITGKAVDWCLKTSKISNLTLDVVCKDIVILRFGSQLFRMHVQSEYHCIRLDVCGENPLIIFNRILEQIQCSIGECMNALRCFPCVPFTPEGSSFTLDLGSDSCILLPLARVQEVVENHSVLNGRGGRSIIDAVTAKSRYGAWLHIYELLDRYDVFLSYRWGEFDKLIVRAIFDMMRNFNIGHNHRAIEVFLDEVRLKNGRRIEEDFLRSLKGTAVVIPVVSYDALQKMLVDDVTEEVDHVLMEWIFAIECLESSQSRVRRIFPVFCGERSKVTGEIASIFGSPILKKLPDVKPVMCLRTVERCLRQIGMIPSAQFETYTVRNVVDRMLSFLGITINKTTSDGDQVESIARSVLELLNSLNESAVEAAADSHSDIVLSAPALAATSGRQVPAHLKASPVSIPADSSRSPSGGGVERSLKDMIAQIRSHFDMKEGEYTKTADVLKYAIDDLDLTAECAGLMPKEKAAIICQQL